MMKADHNSLPCATDAGIVFLYFLQATAPITSQFIKEQTK